MLKFAICNLGCKVNNYESNWYQQQLAQKYQEVDFSEKADIYLINTCTVTNTAGSKSRQMMHRAHHRNPDAVLAVVGCYVQMEANNPDIFEDVDILVGSSHKTEIPQLIDQFLSDGKKVRLVENVEHVSFEEMQLHSFNQTRAYLKIQDGCNQFCSYCTIPLARGRERSLDPDKVIEIANDLTASGHKEIVLTGIHTGRYRYQNTDFTALVKRILNEVDNLERIRISSIEMTEVTDELIEIMASDHRLAHHLHIPLQAGDDEILKSMNRPYNGQQYKEKIEWIRSRIPGISISSDVIVGFPGETEEQFENSRKLIEDCRLSFLHVFPFAAKKGTVAYTMKQQVSAQEKKRRVSELTTLSERLYNDFITEMTGKSGLVLLEKQQDGWLQGHNSEYVMVRIKGDETLLHDVVKVRYTGVDGECLTGEITEVD